MARLRGVDGVVPAVLAEGKRGDPGGGAERRIDMDAVEFIRERNRMCKVDKGCVGCPANKTVCGMGSGKNVESAEKLVQIVEQWAKAHPRKTRQSEFLRQWPGAIVEDGVLILCPKVVMGRKAWMEKGCGGTKCNSCRREFWGAGGGVMARREDLMEALDAIETGMCRIKENRDIWQNELVYALCQGVRLLLTEEIKGERGRE